MCFLKPPDSKAWKEVPRGITVVPLRDLREWCFQWKDGVQEMWSKRNVAVHALAGVGSREKAGRSHSS